MNSLLCIGLAATFPVAGPLAGQAKVDAPARLHSREIAARLSHEVEAPSDGINVAEYVALVAETLRDAGKPVRIIVDASSLAENPLNQPVMVRQPRGTVPARVGLRLVLASTPATFLIRDGAVEIVANHQADRNSLLNRTVQGEFRDQTLSAVLDDLAEQTGASVVVDVRARKKAETLVTAELRNDLALHDAVRMLTTMAELRVVYLPSGLFVTTPEHAEKMRRDLFRDYGHGPLPRAPRVEGLAGPPRILPPGYDDPAFLFPPLPRPSMPMVGM